LSKIGCFTLVVEVYGEHHCYLHHQSGLHWPGSSSQLLLSVQGHLANVYVHDNANRMFAQICFPPHETSSDLGFL